MPLKKLGEKLKTSLHHLSPKSKKTDEAHGDGDLSPCNLPPAATSPQKSSQPSPCPPNTSNVPYAKVNECADASKQNNEEPMRAETPAPTITTADPDICPPSSIHPCDCVNSAQISTPRWEETAEIYPTMYYSRKITNKEPVHQSLLLVNPSKSTKRYTLRLKGDSGAALEEGAISIPGDYVERVNVTVNPEKETTDVYVDLLEGGHLYDRIRVRVQQC